MTIGHDERHALLEELQLLRARRREIEASLEVDDHPHDVGEQAEATERRDELDWIDRRVRDILHLVWAAGAREAVPERVGVGTLVRLRYPDGSLDTVLVTAIPDEDVPSVTPDSPLGMALLGATVGEEVAWNAPQGRLRARVEHIAAGSMP